MDENKILRGEPPFSAGKPELICALLLYPTAYIYTLFLSSAHDRLWFGVFVLFFAGLTEYLNRGRPRPAESWVWLGSLLLISLCVVTGRGRAWDYGLSELMVHALAVWWVLSRSGKLLEGESGHLLPLDVWNGFFRFPFGSFSLRIRCLGYGLKKLGRKRGRGSGKIWAGVLAVLAAVALLGQVATNLTRADAGFGALAGDILALFHFNIGADLAEFIFRFVISLPIGAWLFGLLAGSARMDGHKLRAQADAVNGFLPKLRMVPETVWTVCMAAFAAVYFLFFAVQSSYLFGAFTRTLPEGFIVSQYAREGFFELCRVMAINFSLLYLVSRSSVKPIRENKAQKLACTLLIAAGIIFAVIAFSKLLLYISCFGFTPKRLRAGWLVLTLFAGSTACLYSLWTGKKSFKYWLMFSAVSLALLHIY